MGLVSDTTERTKHSTMGLLTESPYEIVVMIKHKLGKATRRVWFV